MNCTNPAAVNYTPLATEDDGSCIYLEKIGSTCYAFQDVLPALVRDESFTLSWPLETGNWVFYHDYIPDYYFTTREKLFNLYNRKVYRHNDGPPGQYHHQSLKKPFFIDAVFPSKDEFVLNNITWITEVLNAGKSQEGLTITHVTAWNNYQCTGRVLLSTVFELLEYKTHRKTRGQWSFNYFRDLVISADSQFLDDLFGNFSVLANAIDAELPWYEKQLLVDNHVIVRLEFDNLSGYKLLLHEADINANTSYR